MSGLSPRARELFARARADGAPGPERRQRLYDRIERAIAPPPSTPPGPGSGAAGFGGRLILGLVGGSAAGLALWLLSSVAEPAAVTEPPSTVPDTAVMAPAAPEAPPAADQPAVALPGSATARAAPASPSQETGASEPSPTAPQVPRVKQRAPAPAADRPRQTPTHSIERDDFAAELALVREAQQARREHRYPDALAALARHAARFPRGALAPEREVTRALVLCEQGDLERGRALAARFRTSGWAASLAAACEETRGPEGPASEAP